MWACAPRKARPSPARRSMFGVAACVLPEKPNASARNVSIVISRTLGGSEEAGAARSAGRRQPEDRNAAASATANHLLVPPRGISNACFSLFKKEPARRRQSAGRRKCLETDTRAQAHRPGVLDLENRPRGSRAVAPARIALRRRVGFPLQDRVGVQGVEQLGGKSQVRLREERHRLVEPDVELVHVLEAMVGRAAQKNPSRPLAVARVHLDEERIDVALAPVEVRRRREVQWELVEAADVEAPVRVDPHVGEVAAAERLVVELALRTARADVGRGKARPDGGILEESLVGRVHAGGRLVVDLLLPVVVGERAVHHPALRQPLGQLELGPVIVLAVVRPIGHELPAREAVGKSPRVDRSRDSHDAPVDVVSGQPGGEHVRIARRGRADVRGPHDAAAVPVCAGDRRGKIGKDLAVDGELKLVGQRRLQIRVDDVGRAERVRVEVIEASQVLDEGAELSRVHVVIAVRVVPHIPGTGRSGAADRVVPGDNASAQLVSIPRVGCPQQRLAVLPERVIDSGARLEGLPLEFHRASIERQRGNETRKQRVAGHARGSVLPVLVVVAHTHVNSQIAGRDRVPDEPTVVSVFERDEAGPEDVRRGTPIRADAGPPDDLLASEDAVAGPEGRARDRRVSPSEPGLDLVAERPGVEEERGVRIDLMLRPVEDIEGERPVEDETRVLVHIGARRQGSPFGAQAEAGSRVVVGHVGNEGRAEYVGVLTLPDRGGPRLVHRGLLRARDAGRSAELLLVPAKVEDRRAIGFDRLEVQLPGIVVEVRCIRCSSELGQRDLLAAVAAPEPRLLLPERAARLDTVVLDSGGSALAADGADAVHFLVQIAPNDCGAEESQVRLLLGLFGRVVGLKLSGRVEVARGTVGLVGAPFCNHVQRYAGHRDRGIGPTRSHLDLLELVEVVVRRRRAERGHVGDRHAVHVERVLTRVGPHPDVGRLLSALAAGDIQPINLHSGHLLDDHPRIAPGRDALQLRQLVVRPGDVLARVEQGHLARHGHRRRDGRELHRDREIRVLAQVHDDVVSLEGRESLKRRGDSVGADGQIQEVELSLGIRERRLGSSRAGRGRRHSRQDAPLFVHHSSVDVSRARLPQREGGREQESRDHDAHGDLPHRHASSFTMRASGSTKAASIASVRSCLIERVQEQHHCQRRAAARVRTRRTSRRTDEAGRRTARASADAAIQKSARRTKILNRDAGIGTRARRWFAETARSRSAIRSRPLPRLSSRLVWRAKCGTSETKRRTKTASSRTESSSAAGLNRDSRNRTRRALTSRESGLKNLASALAYESCRRACFIGEARPTGEAMALRTILVDDEPLAREWIRQQLAEEEGIEIVAECEDGFKAVQAIDNLRPELLLLDVQMPGLDGFGVLRMLEGGPPPAVVFVTAFDRYALRAFEVHAIDYLLKPVSPERLHDALERGKERLEKKRTKDTAAELVELLREVRRYPDWFLIRTEGRSHFLRVKEIDWIESRRNNVVLHAGAASHLYQETTSGIESKLDPTEFLRIHRSTIVRIDRIKELHPWFNGDYQVILKDGTKLTMSSSYKQKLKSFRRATI